MPIDWGVLRGGARRIALLYGGLIATAVAVSAFFGLATGSSVARAVAVGLYVAGALLLVGCFVTGARGPLRGVSRTGETVPLMGARGVRKATPDERSDAARTSLLLFGMGLGLIVIAALVDPSRRAF